MGASVKPGPSADQIKANLAALRSQGAPDDVIDRYMASVGAKPAEDGAAFNDVAGGASTTAGAAPEVGMGEGLLNAGVQGATLGFGDELTAAMDSYGPSGLAKALVERKNPVDNYRSVRDGLRAKDKAFSDKHPIASGAAEFAGGIIPAVATAGATRGLSAIRAGAAFGGLAGLGNSEGSAEDQAKATAEGAAGGGLLGGIAGGLGRLAGKTGIPQRLADLMPGGAKRQAVRAAATLIEPNEAAATLAKRGALTDPRANVLGETSPDAAALGKVLGRSPKAAITGPRNAWARVKSVGTSRKDVGKEYDALQQKLPLDNTIAQLMEDAGTPIQQGQTDVDFSELHRLRSEVSKQARRATGMSKNDLYDLRNGIDSWLQGKIPQLADVDSRYATLSGHLSDALNSFKTQRKGAVLGAVREAGSNARGADRPLGMWHQMNQMMKPSPAKAADATESLLFNPANTDDALKRIGAERANILNPQQSGVVPRMLGTMAGQLAAPQLSPNTAMAKNAALQLRVQGASDDDVAQQLSALYTPEVVKFVVAATPRRIPQQ